jgi:hypothetical protein
MAMFAHTCRSDPSLRSDASGRLSYKFQRLREQIRASVLSGEFSHRLPGERELGRRYNANAKTINKALSDLSSEGLLIRRVGCGTFVARTGNGGIPQGRSGTVVCLVPGGGPIGGTYREDVVEALAARVREHDHGLRFVTSAGEENGGGARSSAWPAAVRTATESLVFYPLEPLSGGPVVLDDELVAEAYRRHVPMLALGGFGRDPRIGAVVPDYVDAGFRLVEYLIRIGSKDIVAIRSGVENRENELVLDGCRMAAVRYRHAVECLALPEAPGTTGLERRLSGGPGDQDARSDGQCGRRVGLVCVGRRSLEVVLGCSKIEQWIESGEAAVAAVLEPAEPAAKEASITTYEVDPLKMAEWAAKLICDARAGDKPAEISIRGSLRIRGPSWVMATAEP